MCLPWLSGNVLTSCGSVVEDETLCNYIWEKAGMWVCHIKDRLLDFEHLLHSWRTLQGLLFQEVIKQCCIFPNT